MHDPPDELLEQARARVGRVLCGKYRVDRLIGIGGMAAVFEGTHLRNANRVALKILHRDLATQKEEPRIDLPSAPGRPRWEWPALRA